MQSTNRMMKGEVIAQSCHSTIRESILKMKGKAILKPHPISLIAVKTPRSQIQIYCMKLIVNFNYQK